MACHIFVWSAFFAYADVCVLAQMPVCLSSLGGGKQGIKVEGFLAVFCMTAQPACVCSGFCLCAVVPSKAPQPVCEYRGVVCGWQCSRQGVLPYCLPCWCVVTLQGLDEAAAALLLAAGGMNLQAGYHLLVGLMACCTVRLPWVCRSFQVHVCHVTVCVSSDQYCLCRCNWCCHSVP
jgi:hypothetical protein